MICRAEQMYAGSTSTPIRYIVSQSAEQPASPISLPLSNAPTAKASLSLLIINGRTPSKTASGRLIVSDIPIPVKKKLLSGKSRNAVISFKYYCISCSVSSKSRQSKNSLTDKSNCIFRYLSISSSYVFSDISRGADYSMLNKLLNPVSSNTSSTDGLRLRTTISPLPSKACAAPSRTRRPALEM